MVNWPRRRKRRPDYDFAIAKTEPTNELLERLRQVYRDVNQGGDGGSPGIFSEDLWFEDRRPGSPHFGFGRMNRAEAVAYATELQNVASEPPQRSIVEVIAVRGETLAAFVETIDVGNDLVLRHINCMMFDLTLRQFTRAVRLDADDRDAAMSLLDEWHTETNETD